MVLGAGISENGQPVSSVWWMAEKRCRRSRRRLSGAFSRVLSRRALRRPRRRSALLSVQGAAQNAAGCPAAVRRAFCRPKARTGRSACGADSQKPERCLGFGLLSGKRRGLFQSSPCAAVPADVAAPPAPARLGAPGREGRPSAALLCTRAGAGCVSGRDAAFSGRA